MTDEPEPTPEELAAAQALADHLDGKPTGDLSPRAARAIETLEFLEFATKPPDTARAAAEQKARLNLRRRSRWLVRGAIGAAAIAAALVIFFVVGKKPAARSPNQELLQAEADALKAGDPLAADRAMLAYRMELVKGPALNSAAPIHMLANGAIAAGDFATARTTLMTLTSSGGDIARDAWFRIATVDLRAGNTEAAGESAGRGLALGKTPDVFTVNLLLARSAAARSRGNEKAASDDLYEALLIVEKLTQKALEGE